MPHENSHILTQHEYDWLVKTPEAFDIANGGCFRIYDPVHVTAGKNGRVVIKESRLYKLVKYDPILKADHKVEWMAGTSLSDFNKQYQAACAELYGGPTRAKPKLTPEERAKRQEEKLRAMVNKMPLEKRVELLMLAS